MDSHLHLLQDGKFADVVFIVGEERERISCHQLFLQARSPVFEAMFSERWSQDTGGEIQLEDFDPEIFKMFLRFIYTDKLTMDKTDVAVDVPEALELLRLAHKYDVQLLVNKCEELLEKQVTLDHALEVFQAAQMFELEKLKETIGNLWAKSLSKPRVHKSFYQMDKKTLKYLLKREDLDMKEVDIFRLVLRWAKKQRAATGKKNLKGIRQLIRFPTMTLQEFTTTVIPSKMLNSSTVNELLKYFGTEGRARKLLAKELQFSTQTRQPKDLTDYINIYTHGNGTTTWNQFGPLKECLQFRETHGPEMLPTDKIRGIGLSGITFHCPAASRRKSFKTFKICLKLKDCHICEYDFYCNRFYTELLTLATVEVKEGTTIDVKFDTLVPLKMTKFYCITIEEVKNEDDAIEVLLYDVQDFGPGPDELVTVKVKNRLPTYLLVQRNKLEGFWNADSRLQQPNLICRLGFKGL